MNKVLAEYLVQLGPQYLQGKNIVELGSGTGLVGLVAAALNGNRIWITDQRFVFRYAIPIGY
jgi:protein N-lysine methyltransferase METTL21A